MGTMRNFSPSRGKAHCAISSHQNLAARPDSAQRLNQTAESRAIISLAIKALGKSNDEGISVWLMDGSMAVLEDKGLFRRGKPVGVALEIFQSDLEKAKGTLQRLQPSQRELRSLKVLARQIEEQVFGNLKIRTAAEQAFA